MKITPNTPKNESGLIQFIMMGKSIRQIWVNKSYTVTTLFLFRWSSLSSVFRCTAILMGFMSKKETEFSKVYAFNDNKLSHFFESRKSVSFLTLKAELNVC